MKHAAMSETAAGAPDRVPVGRPADGRDRFLGTWTVRCSSTPEDGKVGQSFKVRAGARPELVRFDFPLGFDSEHQWHNLKHGVYRSAVDCVEGLLEGFTVVLHPGAPPDLRCALPPDKRAIWCEVRPLAGAAVGGPDQALGEFGAEEGG
ncbi:MAG: hypothetical protein D6696_05080 [Acidobacteria bacterium]|nr:MAG: hypothetical protein D6696_05080 [Acidobacteriota bacterium]